MQSTLLSSALLHAFAAARGADATELAHLASDIADYFYTNADCNHGTPICTACMHAGLHAVLTNDMRDCTFTSATADTICDSVLSAYN